MLTHGEMPGHIEPDGFRHIVNIVNAHMGYYPLVYLCLAVSSMRSLQGTY